MSAPEEEEVEDGPRNVLPFQPSYQNKSCSKCHQDVRDSLGKVGFGLTWRTPPVTPGATYGVRQLSPGPTSELRL